MQENRTTSQVVLDEASYARDDFKSTPWWDQFKRDLEFAHYIFFCGYSLSDISIKEILIKSPSLRQKTYFVLKDDIADLEREELLDYGHVSLEGRDHFIELAKDQFDAQTDDSVSLDSLRAIRWMHPDKDKRTTLPPTTEEIFAMLSKGVVKPQRIYDTLPSETYVSSRTEYLDQAVEAVKNNDTLIIHSWIGNGKSVFSHILFWKLSGLGYNCFLAQGSNDVISDEVSSLSNVKKVVVAFEDYSQARELIPFFQERIKDASFIICVRTSIQDLSSGDITRVLSGTPRFLDINFLPPTDRATMVQIARDAGAANLEGIEDVNYIRDFVLKFYKNEYVAKQIKLSI